MSGDEDAITILFDAEVSVFDAEGGALGVGDVLVAYVREHEDYRVFLGVGDDKLTDNYLSIRHYRYDLAEPLTVRRVKAQTYYNLRLASGTVYSLSFATEMNGIAFAAYVLSTLWLDSDRSAPMQLILKEGSPDTPFANGAEVKLSSLIWDVAFLASNENAFQVKGIDDPNAELLKSSMRIGAGTVPLLDAVLLGRTKKTKLLIAADGVVMYVDVNGLISAATPPPNLSFQISNGSQHFTPTSEGAIPAGISPPPPDLEATCPQPQQGSFSSAQPILSVSPAPIRPEKKRLSAGARRSYGSERSSHLSEHATEGDDEERGLLPRESTLQLASGRPAFGHSLTFPVDLNRRDFDDNLLEEASALPLVRADWILSHPIASGLRVLLNIAVFLLWVLLAKHWNEPQWNSPYGVLPVGAFLLFSLTIDIAMVWKRESFRSNFVRLVGYRGGLVYRQAHCVLSTPQNMVLSVLCLCGVVLAPIYPAIRVAFNHHDLSTHDQRKYILSLGVFPLFAASLLTVLLKFRLTSLLLHDIWLGCVPPLENTPGGRRDFACSSYKSWARPLVATTGGARQLFLHIATDWAEVLFVICGAVVLGAGWAIWALIYATHHSTSRDTYLKYLPPLAAALSVIIFASTLRGWKRTLHTPLQRYTSHFEFRRTDEAKGSRHGDLAAWTDTLVYLQGVAASTQNWQMGFFHLHDICFDATLFIGIAGFLAGVTALIVQYFA